MATTFTFEIVTPDKSLFSSDEVTYVGFRTLSGGMGIEANHLPLIATLAVAPVKIDFADGKSKVFAVSGGFLEMTGTKCTILATVAECGEDIDRSRAEQAKKRAEERLASKVANIDIERAKAALQRAIVRLKVSDL